MANYYGWTRTNYFKVTDEEKLHSILAQCYCDEDEQVRVWKQEDKDGTVHFAFGCEASINGLILSRDEEDGAVEFSYEAFAKALQEILPEGEACLITEVGHEKLRDLVGHITVVTKDSFATRDLNTIGVGVAQELLGDKNWRPLCW